MFPLTSVLSVDTDGRDTEESVKAEDRPWSALPHAFKDHFQEHRGQASTRGSGRATVCFRACLLNHTVGWRFPISFFGLTSFLPKRSSFLWSEKKINRCYYRKSLFLHGSDSIV